LALYTYVKLAPKLNHTPYHPFVALHEQLFQAGGAQDESWLLEYVREVGPGLFDIVPVVGPALKFAFETAGFALEKVHRRPAAGLPSQDAVFNRFASSLRLFAARAPLLVFFDDWQWADDSSTALLFYLARRLEGVPLLLLVAYRPHDAAVKGHPVLEVRRQLERYHRCEEVALGFLTGGEIAAYYRRRFKAHADPELVDQLAGLTQGNALFVVEYLELLQERGDLTPGGELAVPLDRLPLPKSVGAVVEARLSGLGADDREALDCASVEAGGSGRGEAFTVFFLRQVLDAETRPLLRRMEAVAGVHRLVAGLGYRPFYPGQGETSVYRFVHTLVRLVLYRDLPEEMRVELNRWLLDFKRGVYGEGGEAAGRQLLPQLMLHAAEARDYLAQAGYALEAAGEAARVYAHAEVRKQCEVGLGALEALAAPTAESRVLCIDLLLRRGKTDRFTGQWDRALAAFRQARALAEAEGDEARLGAACHEIGGIHHNQGAYDEALGWYDKALTTQEEPGDRANLATGYSSIGLVHHARGAYKEAQGWYDKALAICEELGDRAGLAGSYNNIGMIHKARGAYEEALGWFRKALAICEELGDRAGLATSYNNIGAVHDDRGAYEEALGWYDKARVILEELGNRAGLAASYNNIGEVHRARGAYEEALGWYDKALAIFEELGDRAGLAGSYNNIGAVHKARGAYEEALGWFHKALVIQEELGDRASLATSYNNIGGIHYARGAYEEALGWYDKDLAISEELGDRAGLAASYNNIGMIHCARGAYEEALGWFHKARAIQEEVGDRPGLARSYNNIGMIYKTRGTYEEALRWYDRSLAIKEELGDRPGLATTLQNVAGVALAQGELRRALELLQRSRDLHAALGLSKKVADEEKMIARIKALLSLSEDVADEEKIIAQIKALLSFLKDVADEEEMIARIKALLSFLKDVADEEMIAQIRAQLSRGQHDIDRGGGY